jgi:hypothetical protein
MKTINTARVGFTGFADEDYDGPELAIQSVLRGIEERGGEIVSVSVLRSTRRHERYEAFIVFRGEERDARPMKLTIERKREILQKLDAIATSDAGPGIALRPPDEGGDPSVTIRILAGIVRELFDAEAPRS